MARWSLQPLLLPVMLILTHESGSQCSFSSAPLIPLQFCFSRERVPEHWVSSDLVMTSHISGRRHVGKGVDIVTECRTRQQLNTLHQPSRSLLISNSSFRLVNLVPIQSLSNKIQNISIFLWRENVSVIIMTTLGHDWENKTIVCQEYWQINNLLCLNFNLI